MSIISPQHLTIDKSTHQSWAFTYKYLGPVNALANSPARYADVICHLDKVGHVSHCIGETDPVGRYHIHGTVLLRKGFLRRFLQIVGFHCHLSEIFNQQGWSKYCEKDLVKKSIPLSLFEKIYESS